MTAKGGHSCAWKWLYSRKRFHAPLREGVKTATLRSQKVGPVGSLVACPVGLLVIEDVVKATPREVGATLWKDEGCVSEADFLAEIKAIHPGIDLDKPLWLHRFRMVAPAQPYTAAQTYRDYICDWCGRKELNDHPSRGDGPWDTWCPHPRDPETPRFAVASMQAVLDA